MNTKKDPGVLDAVMVRFPQDGPAIRKLFETEEEFRDLCGDYVECTAILNSLRREQGANENADRLEQYCELRVNLEAELLNRISSSLQNKILMGGHDRERESL